MLSLKLPPDSSKQDTCSELSFHHGRRMHAMNARLGGADNIEGLYPDCQLTPQPLRKTTPAPKICLFRVPLSAGLQE